MVKPFGINSINDTEQLLQDQLNYKGTDKKTALEMKYKPNQKTGYSNTSQI